MLTEKNDEDLITVPTDAMDIDNEDTDTDNLALDLFATQEEEATTLPTLPILSQSFQLVSHPLWHLMQLYLGLFTGKLIWSAVISHGLTPFLMAQWPTK